MFLLEVAGTQDSWRFGSPETQVHEYVSNLVFYAQSTIQVREDNTNLGKFCIWHIKLKVTAKQDPFPPSIKFVS